MEPLMCSITEQPSDPAMLEMEGGGEMLIKP